MKEWIFDKWHAWQEISNGVLLSDEDTKILRQFASVDETINWLYLNGEKPAARALHEHTKEIP